MDVNVLQQDKTINGIICLCVRAAVESDDRGEEDPSLAVDTETELSTKKLLPSNENTEEKRDEKEKSEEKKENSLSFSNTSFEPVAKRDDLPKEDKPVVKGQYLTSELLPFTFDVEIFE